MLQFDKDGQFLRGWSELIGDIPALVMPAGVAVDPSGGLWVSDASTDHLVHFNLPLAPLPSQVQPPANSQPQIGPQDSTANDQHLQHNKEKKPPLHLRGGVFLNNHDWKKF